MTQPRRLFKNWNKRGLSHFKPCEIHQRIQNDGPGAQFKRLIRTLGDWNIPTHLGNMDSALVKALISLVGHCIFLGLDVSNVTLFSVLHYQCCTFDIRIRPERPFSIITRHFRKIVVFDLQFSKSPSLKCPSYNCANSNVHMVILKLSFQQWIYIFKRDDLGV